MDRRENFVSKKKEHQPILSDTNECCLCGSKLVFKHEVDFLTLKVREEADCPTCQISLKTKDFPLN